MNLKRLLPFLVVLVALTVVFRVFVRESLEPPLPPEAQVVYVEGLGPAEIESQHPLTAAARAGLTPKRVETLEQWQLDQLYARLAPGPLPEGAYRGSFYFAPGGGPRKLSEALGGLRGRLVNIKIDKLNRIGEMLWKGKIFYTADGLVRNMIDKQRLVGEVFGADQDDILTTKIGNNKVGLLFPAHLYCGDSLFDTRRPAVIIDYAGNDTIEGFLPAIDSLAGTDGLDIRDEVRLVRPGFYLGRAYAAGKLLLTFTLFNEDVAAAGGHVEDCEVPAAEPAPASEPASDSETG